MIDRKNPEDSKNNWTPEESWDRIQVYLDKNSYINMIMSSPYYFFYRKECRAEMCQLQERNTKLKIQLEDTINKVFIHSHANVDLFSSQ